jgi:predicted NBD/HSP70 family sugar kinase
MSGTFRWCPTRTLSAGAVVSAASKRSPEGRPCRDGERAAVAGQSLILVRLLAERGRIVAKDIAEAAAYGDPVSRDLIQRAGSFIGQMLATVVNFFNPSVIVIGGGVAGVGNLLVAAVRQAIYGRSLPLATRNLVIQRSALDSQGGIVGAANMVLDEIFTPGGPGL